MAPANIHTIYHLLNIFARLSLGVNEVIAKKAYLCYTVVIGSINDKCYNILERNINNVGLRNYYI